MTTALPAAMLLRCSGHTSAHGSALLPAPTGHFLHRGHVIGAGCLLWAACTATFAACSSLAAGAAVWAVNGLGLALVLPNTQVWVCRGHCVCVKLLLLAGVCRGATPYHSPAQLHIRTHAHPSTTTTPRLPTFINRAEPDGRPVCGCCTRQGFWDALPDQRAGRHAGGAVRHQLG